MKKDDLEDENSGGSRMLALLLVMAVIIAVLYLAFAQQTDNSKHISTVQKYAQTCQPFHFVKAEKAAQGLVRVYCLDKSGEKKEVLIDE